MPHRPDLSRGGINDEYPFLLGHEAAGTVESIGEGVTHVEPGDFVILNWRAVCGECRACKRGRPHLCFDTFNAEQKMTLTDGTELTPALGIGAFVDKTLVHQGQCTKVDPTADPAVAGLLGCGVMAGIGAAINTGAVNRDDTVAVIGCGGVGDAAIAGARLVGATKIIAVDQCLQLSVDVADVAVQRMREALVPGMTENQLWSILHQTNIAHGGEWVEARLLASGPRTNPWFQESSNRTIEAGDLVAFDTDMVGPMSYLADISRTLLCPGRLATGNQRKLYELAQCSDCTTSI